MIKALLGCQAMKFMSVITPKNALQQTLYVLMGSVVMPGHYDTW